MGGFHIGKPDTDAEGIRLIHTGIDRGINFMDNSWDYNNGNSEVRMGKALAQGGYRQKVFLMTKIDGRSRSSFDSQLNQSLTRLQTDHVDLIQFHEILRMEDPDRIFAKDGALEAAIAAKQAGKVRFIGFTGHKDPLVHRRMLEVADAHGFRFDTVQMPINVMDAHFRSFTQTVVPLLVQRKIGVLGMKTFGDHFILDKVLADKLSTPIEMLHYSMTMPVSVVITGIDRNGDFGAGIDCCPDLPAFDPNTDRITSVPHPACGRKRLDGAVQDHAPFRQHGPAPGISGVKSLSRNETSPADWSAGEVSSFPTKKT